MKYRAKRNTDIYKISDIEDLDNKQGLSILTKSSLNTSVKKIRKGEIIEVSEKGVQKSKNTSTSVLYISDKGNNEPQEFVYAKDFEPVKSSILSVKNIAIGLLVIGSAILLIRANKTKSI